MSRQKRSPVRETERERIERENEENREIAWEDLRAGCQWMEISRPKSPRDSGSYWPHGSEQDFQVFVPDLVRRNVSDGVCQAHHDGDTRQWYGAVWCQEHKVFHTEIVVPTHYRSNPDAPFIPIPKEEAA
jgi:hypothetical protein